MVKEHQLRMIEQANQSQTNNRRKTRSRKAMISMVVDILMAVAFLVQMGRVYTGGLPHEITGTVLLVLLVVHNVLNASWWKTLSHGKWFPLRIYHLVIDLLLMVSMLATIVTGVLMSSELYQPLALQSGLLKVRTLHSMLFYMDLMLLGVHIGVHARTIARTFYKRHTDKPGSTGVLVARAFAIAVCVLGLVSAWQVDLLGFITFQNVYSFADADKSALLYYTQHIAVMLLFAVPGHYLHVHWLRK